MDKPGISKLAIAGLVVLAIIIIAGFIFGFKRLFIIFILLPILGMIRLKRLREIERKPNFLRNPLDNGDAFLYGHMELGQ